MTLTQKTKFNFEGGRVKNDDTKIYILNILKQLDLNKVANLEILDFIAEGGFGTVSSCKYLGTVFLLKTLKIIETKAYMDEFKLTYRYRNAGIPKVIAAYEEESSNNTAPVKVEETTIDSTKDEGNKENIGVMFEFIKGMTLSGLLYKKEKGKKKKADIKLHLITRLYYLIQLCSTIDFLHDHDLVHRDLKPDNLIIDNYNSLKVLDFGISIKSNTIIDLLGSSNCYTLKYVPVDLKYYEINGTGEEEDEDEETKSKDEVSIQYKITTAFDVWCVGLIIGEVISGVEPWNGKNDDKIINTIVMLEEDDKDEFEYPMPKPEKFGIEKEKTLKEVIELIKACTVFNPEKRITMKQVKQKLWEILTYEVITDYQIMKAEQNKDKENFKREAAMIIGAFKANKRSLDVVNELENPLISIFKNLNKKLKTDITLINGKITELDNNLLELRENEQTKTMNGKFYAYLTYNEFEDCITGVEFPGRKNFTKPNIVNDLYGKKNYKLKNPYCLNHKNKLYIVGGMIIDTELKEETEKKGIRNKLNTVYSKDLLQNEYLDIFGSNYLKSKKVICYNYNDNKVSTLPDMIYHRGYASSIIYKGFLFSVGDHETIERLNISNLENSTYYTFERWEIFTSLDKEIYSPILLNKNNEYLYILNKTEDSILELFIFKGLSKEYKTIEIDLGTFIPHDFTLRGTYYNMAMEDTFYIFASGKDLSLKDNQTEEEKENKLNSYMRHYCVELSPGKGRMKNQTVVSNFNEISIESPFNALIEKTLKKISFTQMNFEKNQNNNKDNDKSSGLFDNSNFIHNSLEFYYFDDNLHYFTMNVIKAGLTLRTFPSSTFK